jgi:alpha-ketoglutarate-dependent taurine dioxygenase
MTLRGARRKAQDLGGTELVRLGSLPSGGRLPLVAEPVRPEAGNVDLAAWAVANRPLLEGRLLEHGGILFRGFGLASVADFERVAGAICPELFGEYGDLPRAGEGGKVYGATPYPSDQAILFHNEGSHLPRWPLKQFFFCVLPAQQGGETPLLDCREVYRLLGPDLVRRFAEKGLMYIRNFTPGLDVGWQQFFHTEDRGAVEAICKREGTRCEWRTDGGLRLRQPAQAVTRHPRTGEWTFFNQVQLHHPYFLPAEVRQSLRSLFREDDLPRTVTYGDGTPIEETVLERLAVLYWETAVSFPWQAGDLIVLDNMLVAHARKPYVGPRKIVVAMGEMMTADGTAAQSLRE